ncbi:HEAT repeat domain-containing protein [Gloeothece verrucosa]|uniref:HEAT domain containing protein n=1 Tax=Gloeothece verrucosa (strain PCC 7822) TaxID=497965 RepID=E0U9P1_GLOV7|nr:HEAT repeat domain-containing protein [Gloeothece verrucosa]ADN13842.1 HEAT domain containing protein [Gloeothece verrucosa PCC 7822]
MNNESSSIPLARQIRLLAKSPPEKSLAILFETLHSEDQAISAWSAWSLAQIGTETVIDKLFNLLSHSEASPRIWAIWSLGQIHQAYAIEKLMLALEHQDSEIRSRAAVSLGKQKVSAALPFLEKLLVEDSDYSVRGQAAIALGFLGGDKAIELLQRILDDPEIYVHTQATYSLGAIKDPKATEALIKALTHHYPDVRRLAVSMLGERELEDVVEPIIHTLNDSQYFVRLKAVEALGRMATKAAIKGLKIAAHDSDEYVREEANKQLEQLKRKLNFSYLQSFSSHSKPLLTEIPLLGIFSDLEVKNYVYSSAFGKSRKYLISINNPGLAPPITYQLIPEQLRLEFHDLETPKHDLSYRLPSEEDILKVIDFASKIIPIQGDLLVHCCRGITRSSAVALTVITYLLGEDRETEALDVVLAACPQALPNLWIVELADNILNRKGKLIDVVENYRNRNQSF